MSPLTEVPESPGGFHVPASATRPLLLLLLALAASPLAARSAAAQFSKRIIERVKLKATERKQQTEESIVNRAAEPADSALAKVSAPVESLASRVGGGAGAAVGGLGHGKESKEADRLRQELAAGRADLPAVQFELGSATLDPSSTQALQALALALAEVPGVFLVQGRADPGAAQPDALGLGSARAAAVKTWLLANGGPSDRLFATGDASSPKTAFVTVLRMQ